jgi:hypothetical protein
LIDNTVAEIYQGDKASEIRRRLMEEDYSICDVDACPYLAMDDIENHIIETEKVPEYPSELYLGFENICNYSCRSCFLRHWMRENKDIDLEKYYTKIEEKLQPILPYIKRISANGLGEVFCSKHTLNILANWKPLGNPDEIEVSIESNGSLFDEKHWKQIENIGKYKVSVHISVMSFDEPIYQYLSGTKLPISVVENNLRFIKSLREKEIINYFEIATVVQEQNFRTMPDFVQKCLEEFEPDYIRLRPYESWGAQNPIEAWFSDVRNPKHPYYGEYKKVMSNQIINHPTVHDWSGKRDTENRISFPYEITYYKWEIVSEIYRNIDCIIEKVKSYHDGNEVAIYGIAEIGKTLINELTARGYKVAYIIDKNCKDSAYKDIKIYKLSEADKLDKDVPIIVTPISYDSQIFAELGQCKFNNIISIKDLMSDQKLSSEMKEL